MRMAGTPMTQAASARRTRVLPTSPSDAWPPSAKYAMRTSASSAGDNAAEAAMPSSSTP